MEPFTLRGQGGLIIRIPFKQLADPKYSEIYLNCAEAFLILSKLRTVEELKNEDAGQFINLESCLKLIKKS
jgi:CBS domain-containing protein